jgi:hypothetical protein
MNAGAAVAKGDALCFVHADTRVPPDVVHLITSTLRCPHTVAGGFVSLIASEKCTYWYGVPASFSELRGGPDGLSRRLSLVLVTRQARREAHRAGT